MQTEVMSNPTFQVAGLNMSRIWHCFGNYMHQVDLNTVLNMLAASQTNVLPINTHKLSESSGKNGLHIGFGDVQLNALAASTHIDQMILMLNINHQQSAQAAIHKTKLAHALTGELVVKLEVLNADLKTSNDNELIEAAKKLREDLPALILMPLISNDYQTASTLVNLGCPLLRVMGSAIGDAQGILDATSFAKICNLPVPVFLDGGVRNASDFAHAQQLGAQGCLVNSALFAPGLVPEQALAEFLLQSQSVFNLADTISI
jgi:thiazole synthase